MNHELINYQKNNEGRSSLLEMVRHKACGVRKLGFLSALNKPA